MHKRWPIFTLAFFIGASLVLGQEGKKSFHVPFRLTELQHVVVRIKINGQGPFNFLVDTGAPIMFVAVPVAQKIGLPAQSKGLTTLERLEFEGGPVQTKVPCRVETPFQLEGMNGMGLAGVELHGILGYTVLARYRMELDFNRPKMVWTELDFDPPQPVGIKGKGGSGGLEMLGGLMKVLGMLAGVKAAPEAKPRGFWGMQLAEADNTILVKAVLPGSPAATAGLKAKDRIDAIQGQKVRTLDDLRRLTAELTSGKSAMVTIIRGEDKKDLNLTAGEGL